MVTFVIPLILPLGFLSQYPARDDPRVEPPCAPEIHTLDPEAVSEPTTASVASLSALSASIFILPFIQIAAST